MVELLKLDLGCGKNKKLGFVGVDRQQFPGVDEVVDLTKPWPWADNSVGEVHASHFVEHLTNEERVHFYNELGRVLVPGEHEGGRPVRGFATIIVPHWLNERAYGDPTHQWPPVVFFSTYYLLEAWRKQNAPHVGYTCDFDALGGNAIPAPWNARNQETQAFASQHYANVVSDLVMTLVNRKK